MTPNAKDYNPDPQYIRDLIDSTGKTQPVLAELLGVNERTIRRLRSGETTVSYLQQFALECLVLSAE